MFVFVLVQLKKCRRVTQWLLQTDSVLSKEVSEMHRIWLNTIYRKYKLDPHLTDYAAKGNFIAAYLINIPKLAEGWMRTLMKLLKDGSVGFNRVGGMQSMNHLEVLKVEKREELLWPEDEEPETITISRWPNGKHFYLTSSLNRQFPRKYSSLTSAKRAARRFVKPEQIIVKEPGFAYKHEGG